MFPGSHFKQIFQQIHEVERVKERDVHAFGEVVECVECVCVTATANVYLQVGNNAFEDASCKLGVVLGNSDSQASVDVGLEWNAPNSLAENVGQVLNSWMGTCLKVCPAWLRCSLTMTSLSFLKSRASTSSPSSPANTISL